MIELLKKELALLDKSLDWVSRYLEGDKKNNAYSNLVNYRRELKRKKIALDGNPAAAIYGASQVGKSYLVKSILSNEGQPFFIEDGSNNRYDFIERINPYGKGTEATGLVTRFTTNLNIKFQEYPITAKLLSPKDLVIVLCDGYYNDLKIQNASSLTVDNIEFKIEQLYKKFESRTKRIDSLFTEDDILDLEDYFKEHFPGRGSRLHDSQYFKKISKLIEKTSWEEWINIFPMLWNENLHLTQLLHSLLTEYAKLDFCSEVFLPIESVLRENDTLLDVTLLNGITNNSTNHTTSLIIELKGHKKEITNYNKSYLCALIEEICFKLPDSLESEKPFLRSLDLLDFPGTRNRLGVSEDEITMDVIPKLIIRGKVAYLFNKYANLEKINILLLCQNNEKSEVQNILPDLISNWVGLMVGKNEEEREVFINNAKVSPLFVISTMFNLDLKFDNQHDKINDFSSKEKRWERRFIIALNEVFGVNNWFKNWTISTPNFSNIFLLRDFYYSSEAECNLFKGYIKDKREVEEILPEAYPTFKSDLKSSFLDYTFVKDHFIEPESVWRAVSELNKDGSSAIIDKINVAAINIEQARIQRTKNQLNALVKSINSEIYKNYHSDDKDAELNKAKDLAGSIQFRLDSYFGGSNINKFGLFMNELMIDEAIVRDYFKENESFSNSELGEYILIWNVVPPKNNESTGQYFDRLCNYYGKISKEQKDLFFNELQSRNIDLNILAEGKIGIFKNKATYFSEALLDYWISYISTKDKKLTSEILERYIQDIQEMFFKLFKMHNLADKIASNIKNYIEQKAKEEIPYEIIADISTEILNNCIQTVGFNYLDSEEIEGLKNASEINDLSLVLDYSNSKSPADVKTLFEEMVSWDIIQSNSNEISKIPSFNNYLSWRDKLKVGFVSVCDIPNYDVDANRVLGEIINDLDDINF